VPSRGDHVSLMPVKGMPWRKKRGQIIADANRKADKLNGEGEFLSGRFRSFLLTSMSSFLANAWDKARAQKRGGGRTVSLPFDTADTSCRWEQTDNVTPERTFEWRWALVLLDQVINRLCPERLMNSGFDTWGARRRWGRQIRFCAPFS
jgi:hypothetical protein